MQFSGLREGVLGEYVVRVRVRTYAGRELAAFGTAPSPLAGTLAPQDTGTNDTIGKVRECTDVRKVGKVRQVYDANIVARPPQINYKSMQLNTRRPGPYH